MRLLKYPSLGVALYCISIQAFGVETGVTAGLSTEWNDNVYLSSTDRQHDWLETLTLDANLNGSESSYQYGTRYNLSYKHYQNGSYGSNSYYNGNAFLNLVLVPERLQWYSSVESATTLIDSTQPNIPTNRDQRTTYMTSPMLTLISLPRDNLTLSAQASKVDYRESGQSDSDRAGGNLTWTHTLSPLTQFSLMASHQKVNFTTVPDYKIVSYQAGIMRKINGGDVEIDAGRSKITPNDGSEIEGASYTANINWSSQEHSWHFQAYRDLTDSTQGLSGSFGSTGFVTPTDVNTGQVDIIVRTRYGLDYTYTPIATLRINSSLNWDDQKSKTRNADTLRKSASFGVSRDLSQDLSAGFDFSYEHNQTDQLLLSQIDIIKRYRITLEKDFQKKLKVSGWIGRQEDNRNLTGGDYEQHVIGAQINYQF